MWASWPAQNSRITCPPYISTLSFSLPSLGWGWTNWQSWKTINNYPPVLWADQRCDSRSDLSNKMWSVFKLFPRNYQPFFFTKSCISRQNDKNGEQNSVHSGGYWRYEDWENCSHSKTSKRQISWGKVLYPNI